MMKLFYNIPTQVMFWDSDEYVAGIAYRDEIICGCCGGIFEIETVVEIAQEEDKVPMYEFDSWVSLHDEICGDMTIEDLMERE